MKPFPLEPEFDYVPPPPQMDPDEIPPPPPAEFEIDVMSIPPPPPVDAKVIPAPPPRKKKPVSKPAIMSTKNGNIVRQSDLDILSPSQPKLELWGGIQSIQDSTIYRDQQKRHMGTNSDIIKSEREGTDSRKLDDLLNDYGSMKIEQKPAPKFSRGSGKPKPKLEIDVLEGNYPQMKLTIPTKETSEQVEEKTKPPVIPKREPKVKKVEIPKEEPKPEEISPPAVLKQPSIAPIVKSSEDKRKLSAQFTGSPFDQEIFSWVNKVRAQPKSFIPFLEERLTRFEKGSNNFIISARERLVTHEGKAAVEEAIEFLEKQQSLTELKWNEMLMKACEDHVKEIGSSGLYTHVMKDGTQPTDRVLSEMGEEIAAAAESLKFNSKVAKDVVTEFLVDDGVKSRGNRTNLFGDWDMLGCFTGDHKVSGSMTTVLFSQSVSMSQGVLSKLIEQVNVTMQDPDGWMQKQQKIMFTGEEITLTNIYRMIDGTEKVVEVSKAVKDGSIV